MLITKRRYFVSIALVLMLVFSTGAAAYATDYPSQDDNGKMWFDTDISDLGEEDDYLYAFNIQGYVGEDLLCTTYDNWGYEVFLQEEGDEEATQVGTGPNGVERVVGEIGFTNRLTFVNGGNYVKVEYIIRNTTSSAKTVSIATTSDTQIGEQDDAPMEVTDSAIIMRDGDTAQFNIICRDAYGVTDVDGMWIGYYDYQWEEMFTDEGPCTLEYTDSGLAFSWIGIDLPANGTKTFSVLFGVGAANDAPVLTLNPISTNVTPGQELIISGKVTDTENSIDTKIYYVLDDGEPTLLYNFDEEPGTFIKKLVLPSDADFTGEHTIMFYAVDDNGALSTAVKKTISLDGEADVTLDDTPETGDNTPMGLWILAMLSLGGILLTSATNLLMRRDNM